MDIGPIALLCQSDAVHTQIPVYDNDSKRDSIYNSSSGDLAKGYLIATFEFTSSSTAASSSSLTNLQDKSISLWKDILLNPDTFHYTNDKYKPLHISFGGISLPPTTTKEILENNDSVKFKVTDATSYYTNTNHSNYLTVDGNTNTNTDTNYNTNTNTNNKDVYRMTVLFNLMALIMRYYYVIMVVCLLL